MRFLYVKEAEIPEEMKRQYPNYKGIEVALGDINIPSFGDYANGTVIVTLVPIRIEKPRQILAMLSRMHNLDTESLTQYVNDLAGNERFLIDTLKDRVVEEEPLIAVNGSEN